MTFPGPWRVLLHESYKNYQCMIDLINEHYEHQTNEFMAINGRLWVCKEFIALDS